MSVISNVSYSGLNVQNVERLKDIQRAENAVNAYYDFTGGVTKRTSSWHIDDEGNVSHYAHVRREGVSYEKTIPDSVSIGFRFLQNMEKQFGSTKFFQGTVSYGSRPVNQSSVLQDMTDYAEKIRQEKLEEQRKAEQELKEYFGDRFIGFSVKWLEEEIKKEEVTEAEENMSDSEKESESVSTSVGVNVGKTARKIAAAKTREQLRMVISEIRNDMQVVKDGMEKGYCDESEMAKVEMLMSMAQNRMGQVEDREATPEEKNMFAMASLM